MNAQMNVGRVRPLVLVAQRVDIILFLGGRDLQKNLAP